MMNIKYQRTLKTILILLALSPFNKLYATLADSVRNVLKGNELKPNKPEPSYFFDTGDSALAYFPEDSTGTKQISSPTVCYQVSTGKYPKEERLIVAIHQIKIDRSKILKDIFHAGGLDLKIIEDTNLDGIPERTLTKYTPSDQGGLQAVMSYFLTDPTRGMKIRAPTRQDSLDFITTLRTFLEKRYGK